MASPENAIIRIDACFVVNHLNQRQQASCWSPKRGTSQQMFAAICGSASFSDPKNEKFVGSSSVLLKRQRLLIPGSTSPPKPGGHLPITAGQRGRCVGRSSACESRCPVLIHVRKQAAFNACHERVGHPLSQPVDLSAVAHSPPDDASQNCSSRRLAALTWANPPR